MIIQPKTLRASLNNNVVCTKELWGVSLFGQRYSENMCCMQLFGSCGWRQNRVFRNQSKPSMEVVDSIIWTMSEWLKHEKGV